MYTKQGRSARSVIAVVSVLLLLSAGCSDEVRQILLTTTESGVKTIFDGLISALFVVFAGNRGGF